MKATVMIEKSFDDGVKFKKDYDFGDFLEFFNEEGKYLDRLAAIVGLEGDDDDSFTVTYTVKLVK